MAGLQVYKTHHAGSQDLPREMAPVAGLEVTFDVDTDAHVFVSGHMDLEHVGKAGTEKKAVMYAVQLKLDGRWIRGSKTGANILSRTMHYAVAQLDGYALVTAGRHTVQVCARSASTAAPTTDGLVRMKPSVEGDEYNQMVCRVEPVG